MDPCQVNERLFQIIWDAWRFCEEVVRLIFKEEVKIEFAGLGYMHEDLRIRRSSKD